MVQVTFDIFPFSVWIVCDSDFQLCLEHATVLCCCYCALIRFLRHLTRRVCLWQGDRGFDGLPGLPGDKGHRVSSRSKVNTAHHLRNIVEDSSKRGWLSNEWKSCYIKGLGKPTNSVWIYCDSRLWTRKEDPVQSNQRKQSEIDMWLSMLLFNLFSLPLCSTILGWYRRIGTPRRSWRGRREGK